MTDQPATTPILDELRAWKGLFGEPKGNYTVPDVIRIDRAIQAIEQLTNDNGLLKLQVEVLQNALAIVREAGTEVSPIFIEQLKREILIANGNYEARYNQAVERVTELQQALNDARADAYEAFGIEPLRQEMLATASHYRDLHAHAIKRAEDAEHRLNEVTNALKCQYEAFKLLRTHDNPAGTVMDAIASMLDLPDDLAHGYGPLDPNSPPAYVITWRAGVHRGWLEFGKRLVAALTKSNGG